MAIPLVILEAIGVTAADLAEFAPWSNLISEFAYNAGAYEVLPGANLKFYSLLGKAIPTLTRSQLTAAYRIASYYANPAYYLAQGDPDIPIARGLARQITDTAGHLVAGENYRYAVKFEVYYPSTGKTADVYEWIYRPDPTSWNDLGREGWDKVQEKIAQGINTPPGRYVPEAEMMSFSITDVVVFIP